MSYRGKTADLPCGQGGLDGNQNVFQVPINKLLVARNIRFDGLTWRKAPGLGLFDSTAITAAPTCFAGIDWRPAEGTQRQVTVWNNGNIYKETGNDIDAVTLKTGLTITNPACLIEGGSIDAGEDRKLYFFSKGNAPLQLAADGVTMSALTSEPSDWSVNKPGAAVYHDQRVIAFDLDSAPHNFYISSLDDHGAFDASDSRAYEVAPGQGDRIVAGWSFLPNQLYLFKYPRGIWSVDTTDMTGYYLPISIVRDDIGMAGPHAICKIGHLTWFISSNGRLYILEALRPDVDPLNADMTAKLRLTEFIKQNVNANKLKFARLVYDEFRRELLYIYTSKNGTTNDSVIVLDLLEEDNPKVATDDRGAYYHSVWRRIGTDGFTEILCAGADGLVRRMNDPNRSIDLTDAYFSELRYPDTDFDFVPRNVYKPVPIGSVQKRFDMLEITVLPTGNFDMSAEFIVDGVSTKTETFNLGAAQNSEFDSAIFDTATFGGQTVYKHRIPIEATGNQLGIRLYNSGLNEDFSIVNLRVYFQTQGQNYET